ncbi:MAG: RNA polymerase sigma factor [Chitinophagaceae bacterium]
MIPVRHIQTISTDEELLLDFQEKLNAQSLATLYLRYTDLVYGACMKYFKDGERSKDAVMEIYQEISIKLKTHQVENFKGWLYVVARNHCLMQLRKTQKNIVVEFDNSGFVQSEDFSHLDAVLEKEKDFKKLETCVDQLNDDQKLVINLFYLQQKCYNDIVDETGIEWSKVRSMVQNGRRNLKICMEKNG